MFYDTVYNRCLYPATNVTFSRIFYDIILDYIILHYRFFKVAQVKTSKDHRAQHATQATV